MLSQHVQRRYATALLESGATGVGYLLKPRVADIEALCADARRLCAGGARGRAGRCAGDEPIVSP